MQFLCLLPKCSLFGLNQVQRASDFKTSMSKPVPTNQISACENPDQVEVSQEGFLKEEGKKAALCLGELQEEEVPSIRALTAKKSVMSVS